jgi:phosphoadenosine phosphosulfate reductase
MQLDLTSLDTVNRELGSQPESLIAWALSLDERAVATTSFSPFSGVILHMATQVRPNLPILWMDTGYNTPETYRYADQLTRQLQLNLTIVHPRRSRAHREALDGGVPELGDPRLEAFTSEVKLEPFERGMAELAPKIWITGVRAEETAERARMQPVSLNPDGLIKVAPLLGWNSRQLHEYLKLHGLPNNFDYYDPTKVEDQRECGLHLAH